ncbi:MAG: hypothetical protein IJO98_04320 [Clostridia bacterium]|nr:hypothetical protein [Clostridia bacterium]
MNKIQVMEYLKVVCDAENAILACDKAIADLKSRMGIFWKMPDKPVEPQMEVVTPVRPRLTSEQPMKEVWQEGWGIGTAIIGGVIGFIMMWICAEATDGSLGSLWFLLLGLIGLPLGVRIWSKRDITTSREAEVERVQQSNDAAIRNAKKETEKLEEAARWRYNLKWEEYQKELAAYNAKTAAITNAKETTLSMLRDMIQENEQTRERIRIDLEKLYAKNIVYPTFRNIVAVNQIYEYLAMGLCESLEGPTGAYSQYIEDLRTNKICDSIGALQASIESGMKHILMGQSRMVEEMKSVNRNVSLLGGRITSSITSLGQQIESSFTGLEGSIQGVQGELSANRVAIDGVTNVIQAGTDNSAAIAGQLNEVRKTLQTSAHNEYVALRETKVKNYLKNPGAY